MQIYVLKNVQKLLEQQSSEKSYKLNTVHHMYIILLYLEY